MLEEAEEELMRPEETPAVTGLKLEEEEAIKEAEKVTVAEIAQPRTMRIGGHEVVEELREGEDLSYLRCVRCGLAARLDEVARLMEAGCSGTGAEQASREAEKRACEYCGGPAIGAYPIEYVGGSPVYIALCADCVKRVEEMYVVARPNIADRSGKRLIRCRHPMEGVRRLAWYHYTTTWFMMDEEGRWPCPACGAAHDRLLEAIKHFMERHPDLVSKSGRGYISGIGEVWRTWQGYYCPVCGLLCDSLKALKEHYESHRGR